MKVKFGEVVKDVKLNVDRANNPYEFYVAGDHMDSEDFRIHRKGCFATDDVGPAFVRIFKPGQVLYGSRRTYLKKVCVADFEGVTANTTFVLETKDENVLLQKLLPFLMLSDGFTNWSIKHSKGSTNPYVLFSDLADYEFSLPPLERQRELAELLWAANDLKEKYKALIAATDEMLKAKFREMFGEISKNDKNWRLCRLQDVIIGGPSNGYFAKSDEYVQSDGVKILGVTDIVNRIFAETIRLPRANVRGKNVSKYNVEYGDMLFCRSSLVREGIGKAAIIPYSFDGEVLFECHVIRVKLDLKKCNPIFMEYLSWTDDFRSQVMSNSKTTTMTTIGQDGISSLKIFLPPLSLQRSFVAIAEKAEGVKAGLKKSIAEVDAVIKGLVNEG